MNPTFQNPWFALGVGSLGSVYNGCAAGEKAELSLPAGLSEVHLSLVPRSGSCCSCLGGNWLEPVEGKGALLQGLWQACAVKHYFSAPFNHVDKLSMQTILFLN